MALPRLILVLCLASGLLTQASAQQDRLRVLFLGDRGHHQPEARLHQVYGELARARIAVDYEERVEALTPERLALYDVLKTTKVTLSNPKWTGFSTEAYIFLAILYFVCCYAMSSYSRKLEKELHTGH